MSKRFVVLVVTVVLLLSGCSPKLGGSARVPLTNDERLNLIHNLGGSTEAVNPKGDLYNENGIKVTSTRKLEVESWKLQELAKAYEEQHSFDYVLESVDLPKRTGDWMTSSLTTKDFKSTVRLYGDDTSMTLDIQLSDEAAGKYVIAPQGCIINGVLKDKTLFRVKEVSKGHFLITADMSGFEALDMFGLNMDNISSLAWYLTAIDTETKKMTDFFIASAFPDDVSWEGIEVSDNFEASSGIVMWVLRSGDSSYLCAFNGSDKKIDSEIKVSSKSGNLISSDFKLDVSSGELVYLKIGFNVAGVKVTKGSEVIFEE